MFVHLNFAYINFAALPSPSFLISQNTYTFCPKAGLVSCYVSSPLPLSLQNKNRFLSMSFLVLRPPPHFKLQALPTMSLLLLLLLFLPLTKIFICDLCPVALFEKHAYDVPKWSKDGIHVYWTRGLQFRKSARLATYEEFCVGGLDSKFPAHMPMCLFLWSGFQKKISVWNYGSSDFLEYETKGTRSGQMAVPASSSSPPPKET
jgi:hypothetical protein